MSLQFDTPEEIAAHRGHRALAGTATGMAGGAAGAALGARRHGWKGGLIGMGIGAVGGHAAGGTAADVAHDLPQRAGANAHGVTHRLDALGGDGIRVAAAMPTATEFAEFVQGDTTLETPDTSRVPNDYDRPVLWGPEAPLEGGDAHAAGYSMGLPASRGV